MITGYFVSLVFNVIVPVRTPVAVGVKITVMVQVERPAIVLPQIVISP